jgi:hypothetical protein
MRKIFSPKSPPACVSCMWNHVVQAHLFRVTKVDVTKKFNWREVWSSSSMRKLDVEPCCSSSSVPRNKSGSNKNFQLAWIMKSRHFARWILIRYSTKANSWKIFDLMFARSKRWRPLCMLGTLTSMRNVQVWFHHINLYEIFILLLWGACLDSGAEKSVCGLAQIRLYARRTQVSLRRTKAKFWFKFGDMTYPSIGNW